MTKRNTTTQSSTATTTDTSTTSQPAPEPTTFTDTLPLPRLLVFDLDYTLWPFWVDTHPSPPFRPLPAPRTGLAACDRSGSTWAFYPEVPRILAAAKRRGIPVAAASRTSAPEDARALLRLLSVPGEAGSGEAAEGFFGNLQIYPGDKVGHMRRLKKEMGVEFEDMLFFDDEVRNRNVERELGVRFVLVRDGVTRAVVDEGVWAWRKARGIGRREGSEGNRNRKGVDVVLDA